MKRFQVTALAGCLASAIAFYGILGFGVLPMPYATAKALSSVFITLAVVGLALSSTAVCLGRWDGQSFGNSQRTFVAAYAGIAMASILILLRLLRSGYDN